MPAAAAEEPEKKKENQEEGQEEAQRQADPRCAWFEDAVVRTLKVKSEKYKKLLMMPDSWCVPVPEL